MASPAILCILFISLSLFTASLASTSDSSPTVYELLEKYDFPVGLLPKGVTGYELNSTTGKFTVYLNKTCSFTIDGYNLKYKTEISGTISTDKIKDLKGIQVKVLFFWINIVEVTKDGDELELSVGIASADFTVDNFYESPECGCGFDCNNGIGGKAGKFRFNSKPFVSDS
ncbi:unnamed protein product [Fraxinus pennsylvanica]|uniref:DUF538 family protein n=1 Tax=Fraxinus pennsylvanica TaxID=56036 RepID=A0AAD2DWX6_9LAMI|nr:unnamed protein product [Fraxinus pennsylvanica]